MRTTIAEEQSLSPRELIETALGQSEDGASLRVQAVQPEDSGGRSATIATLGAASRGVGMPRLVRHGSFLYAAWTNPEGGGVQAARLGVDGLR